MKPRLALPRLDVPRLGLASFRRRILFRAVFLLLAIATVALAVVLLRDEKERSYRNYQQNFRKTQADVMARLRHPSGQLALLNPSLGGAATPVRPLVLPDPALDFDDPNKPQQAAEAANCAVRYADGSTLCAGIGSNPITGGFLYLVGSFRAGDLLTREPGVDLDLETVHRAVVKVDFRGATLRWVAPFERQSLRGEPLVRGRLPGYPDTGDPLLPADARAPRDFRGWFWQSATCASGGEQPDCPRRVSYALRLPVPALREGLGSGTRPDWPPADLDRMRVQLQVLAPGQAEPLFDSNAAGALAPMSLGDVVQALLPGETLSIRRQGAATPLLALKGREDEGARSSPLILQVIDALPVTERPPPVVAREAVTTPLGAYDVSLVGDARGIDRGLGVIATRMSWYVAAMLAAIFLAWLVIEVGLIRRITVLTRRAAAVSHNVQKDAPGDARIGQLDVSDLRGPDELGILAGSLSDLLQRVKDDQQREQLRAQRERDMLQAVGHEILSPLQSLMALHPDGDDPAHRYVQRMQQAVRVLYGQASPSEALQAAELELAPLDLDAFLREVAGNAHFAGIEDVRYAPQEAPVMVRADAFSLEDVVTHILRNAQRYRLPGTPVTLSLTTTEAQAVVGIHNQGPAIDEPLLGRIFDYGVSDSAPQDASGRRGQGLFVARTYLAKMGGSIAARNEDDGVRFILTLPRAG